MGNSAKLKIHSNESKVFSDRDVAILSIYTISIVRQITRLRYALRCGDKKISRGLSFACVVIIGRHRKERRSGFPALPPCCFAAGALFARAFAFGARNKQRPKKTFASPTTGEQEAHAKPGPNLPRPLRRAWLSLKRGCEQEEKAACSSCGNVLLRRIIRISKARKVLISPLSSFPRSLWKRGRKEGGRDEDSSGRGITPPRD